MIFIFGPCYKIAYKQFEERYASENTSFLTIEGHSSTDVSLLETTSLNTDVIITGHCSKDLRIPVVQSKELHLIFAHTVPNLKRPKKKDYLKWKDILETIGSPKGLDYPEVDFNADLKSNFACFTLHWKKNNTNICNQVAKLLEDIYIKHGGSLAVEEESPSKELSLNDTTSNEDKKTTSWGSSAAAGAFGGAIAGIIASHGSGKLGFAGFIVFFLTMMGVNGGSRKALAGLVFVAVAALVFVLFKK